jgi:hypothetical protein
MRWTGHIIHVWKTGNARILVGNLKKRDHFGGNIKGDLKNLGYEV